jgi:uncharacterized membrane protein
MEHDESGESAALRARAEKARDEAHRPHQLAAGGYARPVHPVLVSLPIGCFAASFVFDVVSLLIEGRAFGRPAAWLVACGVVAGLIASLFGALDLFRLPRGTAARRTGTRHAVAMSAVLVLYTVSFFLRRADPTQYGTGTPIDAFVVGVVAVPVLFAGVVFGGALVYRYGVRVADESDQLLGYLPPDTVRGSERR